ncbi:hypothetical protein PTW37_08710 [Arthrobacter agilis]|uniref:hypothetical protein n=1 Tax=Arthrobacter agilis TaxID=37921 RepID=UPI002366BD88|nr:hypothetical protein [Arthrobacter agilis]WDF31973.1 hypothetical protein PTW37_08710 [Arthrobacter agilis]
MMDANQRQGAAAEMRVALALVEAGCSVNSLALMDFGMDLNVQVPRGLPSATATAWEMSQQTANLQIKSSRSAAKQATVPHALAAEWGDGAQRTSPMFLILCVGTDYFLFDTARIRRLAEQSIANKRKKLYREYSWEDELGDPPGLEDAVVSFSATNGLRVSIAHLPRFIVHWTINAAALDNLARLDVDLSQGINPGNVDVALKFIGLAVAAYATRFFDYEEYKYFGGGGAEETYALAKEMITANLGDQDVYRRASDIVSRVPITPSGWGDTPLLHFFTRAADKETASKDLIELATQLAWRP